jgi:hypothetical protein
LERVVNGFERQIEKEWPARIAPVLEPCQGLVCQNIGGVSLESPALVIDIKRRVEIRALALKADPMVETGPWSIVLMAHVPFADEGRLIAGLLEVPGEKHRPFRLRPLVIDNTMVVHVLSGENRSPAGRA